MFGISFSEIILICVIALIVIGPKQLPVIATRVGLIIYSVKNYFTSLKHEVYHNSGVGELINTKTQLLKTYSNVRSIIRTNNTIIPDEIQEHTITPNLTETQAFAYQPELDFDAQPELFDKPSLLNVKEQFNE
jgi:Tat protein translocase TatB subunit